MGGWCGAVAFARREPRAAVAAVNVNVWRLGWRGDGCFDEVIVFGEGGRDSVLDAGQ